MKLLALFIFPLSLAWSSPEPNCTPSLAGTSGLTEIIKFAEDNTEIAARAERMSDYRVSGACNKKGDAKNVSATFYHCKDGSVSFKQPSSTGWQGWNGYCGETAASNVLYMSCSMITSPIGYCNAYTDDVTPGTRPSSLASGLNRMFDDNKSTCPKGKWKTYNDVDSPREYIDYLVGGLESYQGIKRLRSNGKKIDRSPFPIMIEVPPKGSKGLHWVTVIDVEGFDKTKNLYLQDNCQVTINHWSDQYKVPCERLSAWAKRSGCGIAGAICGEYPRVKFVAD